jgi:hypothetical protein
LIVKASLAYARGSLQKPVSAQITLIRQSGLITAKKRINPPLMSFFAHLLIQLTPNE